MDPLDSAVSYSSVMILVQNMLKLDYSMQVRREASTCHYFLFTFGCYFVTEVCYPAGEDSQGTVP